MKKLISLLAALGLGATGASTVVSCGDDTTTPDDSSSKDFASVADISLAVGATEGNTFTVSDKDSTDATTAELTVKSSDEKIATAEVADGVVTITPVAAGSATITVSADGYNDLVVNLTISDGDAPAPSENKDFAPVADMTIKMEATEGNTFTVSDKDSTDATTAELTVKSGDDTIATATEEAGVVTIVPVKEGTTTITVSADGYNDLVVNLTIAAKA